MGLATAELLADGGAAAQSDDLFRCAAYLEAEGATHTLRIAFDGGESLVPLIVREIEVGAIDAISPYGYPGGVVSGAPPDAAGVDWGPSGLVSIFARERLGAEPWLAGVSGPYQRTGDPRPVQGGSTFSRFDEWGSATAEQHAEAVLETLGEWRQARE